MAQSGVMVGQWEDILARDTARLTGHRVRVSIEPDIGSDEAFSIEAPITGFNGHTPTDAATARKRVLDSAPEPLPLPPGKTLEDVVVGKWPGDESDEVILEALRRLS